jgi:hypothetical protein
MTETGGEQPSTVDSWPTFALRCTFNPAGVGLRAAFDPDEVVVFDATRGRPDRRWIAAKRGSYVAIEETR